MPYTTVSGGVSFGGGVTAVDCQKQVRSWRLLRSLMELLIPSCNCLFEMQKTEAKEKILTTHYHNYYYSKACICSFFCSTRFTDTTIFGYRSGKLYFYIQTSPKSVTPLLLLELSVPIILLAREMRSGILRIALESEIFENTNTAEFQCSLLSMPFWSMYCNGKKVGFAVKRKPTKADVEVLQQMESVPLGAGTFKSGKEINHGDEIMYLRGNFESTRGSSEARSFHLVDPDGNVGQELSIFFLRSME